MGIRTPPASASSPSGTNRTATQPRHSEFRQITIKDVARLAGVSLMTVSRALNRPELVSAKTRELVRQAVERTGYIPNRLGEDFPACTPVRWPFLCPRFPTWSFPTCSMA